MPDVHANFAVSTVATAPSPATSGTSLVVAAGEGALFPTVPFNATIWPTGVQPTSANAEVVRVTVRSTDTLTITRTQESTSARTVVVGDQIAATITKKTLTDMETSFVFFDSTLGSAAASFDITSIPTGYRKIMVELTGRGDTASTSVDVYLRFNGDTGSNYDYNYLRGTNATASSFASVADALGIFLGTISAASATAAASGMSMVEVLDYTSTTFHKLLNARTADKRGTTTALLNMFMVAGYWRSTAAVTQVTVRTASGNFDTGTRCTVILSK